MVLKVARVFRCLTSKDRDRSAKIKDSYPVGARGKVFVLKKQTNFLANTRTTQIQMATHYTDSSGEEFVPNSQSDNEGQSPTDEAHGLVSSSEETPVEADEEEDQSEPVFDDDTTDEEHITNHNRKK